ncbi:MAG: DUF2779 domain-containing protein [Gemmatimonadetes bacterium]|nr:DUF2779 domain-containing protein [Gemmatimonadota bacterium]
MSGLQCHRKLYLACHQPELAAPPDAAQQALFDAGSRIGEIARELRPGGVLIDEPYYRHREAVERTRSLLTKRNVPAIYEAGFLEDGVRIRVDILARSSGKSWDIIEVKSSASTKDVHIPDAAVQLIVVEMAGLTVDKIGLAHINRDYVYPGGDYDIDQLLTVDDITVDVRTYAEGVADQLDAMRQPLAENEPPDIAVGSHCNKPYKCEFYAHCRSREPDWSIEDLPRLTSGQREDLRARGIRSILEIPDGQQLSPVQERARQSVIANKPQASESLSKALDRIVPPAHFLDFETLGPALPVYPGTRPYDMVPFQWSDHVLEENGDISHSEFLAEGQDDPRAELAEALVAQLAGAATVVAYSSYEQTCIRSLIDAVPDQQPALERILALPWVDLLKIVQGHYYHRDFHGSFSIKSVLPALAPDFGYDDLEIQDGNLASVVFLESNHPDTKPGRREHLRRDLLAYCKRDTEAMLRVVEAMRDSTS